MKPSHSPFTTNLVHLAEEVLDPGMSLWYMKLAHEQYITVLQHTETRRLYCTTKGCHCSFDSLRDWQQHYHLNFTLCGVFTKAMFVDNQVLPMPGYKLIPGNYPTHDCTYIQKKTDRHSYAWKSLGDLIYGKKLSHDLHLKLNQIK